MLRPVIAGDVVIKGGVMNKYYALLICETTASEIAANGAKIFEFEED